MNGLEEVVTEQQAIKYTGLDIGMKKSFKLGIKLSRSSALWQKHHVTRGLDGFPILELAQVGGCSSLFFTADPREPSASEGQLKYSTICPSGCSAGR